VCSQNKDQMADVNFRLKFTVIRHIPNSCNSEMGRHKMSWNKEVINSLQP